MSKELYCCERCEMIGTPEEAATHALWTGHRVRCLTKAERDGVVAIWRGEGRQIPWEHAPTPSSPAAVDLDQEPRDG